MIQRSVSGVTPAGRLERAGTWRGPLAGLFLMTAWGCDSPPSMPDAGPPTDAAVWSPDGGGEDAGTEDAGADAGEALPERVQSIVDALRPAMYDCPDRVWPGITDAYRESQILLVDAEGGTAYLFNDRRGSPSELVVTQLSTDELSTEWFASFNVGVFHGADTLGISLDFTGTINEAYDQAGIPRWHDYAVILAVHEGFHFLSGQSEWPLAQGSRAEPYPVQWEPHYLRAALGRVLVDILHDESGASAGIARYWLDRFETELPDDAARIATTDVHEGSASYAEIVSAALGELGCGATPTELRETMLSHLDEYATFDSFVGDSASYDLGAAAGLLMRFAMNEGWESMVAQGTPPASVLLAGATATPVPDDPALQQEAQDAVAEQNESAAAKIDPMLDRLDSPDHYRLPLSPEWGAGALTTSGFYILTERAGAPEALLEFEADFVLPSADQVSVAGQSVVMAGTTPCPDLTSGGFYVVQIARADVTAAGGEHTSTATDVMFTDLTASVVSSDGFDWLCPSVSE